jgi:hypothetical protein
MATRFANKPVVAYQPKAGETIFAWQIKPELAAQPARPRDILVMVDTSASQAGKPIQQARQIITGLADSVGPDDRICIWTVCTPTSTKPLTNGFQPGNSDDLRNANAALGEIEYGSGATDLKYAMNHAIALPINPARQQIILFLGDGESAASTEPITESIRVELAGKLEQSNIAFYAVPLGLKIQSHNLHGLATLTGGAVVRLAEDTATVRGQTDFSAKSTDFVEIVQDLADLVAAKGVEAVAERQDELDALKISKKENIELGQVVRFEAAADNILDSYLHLQDGRGVNAVLVELQGGTRELAHDIAVHVAFAKPPYLSRDQVDPAAVEKERQALLEITKAEGKPEPAWPKIVEGRLNAWYKDQVLLEQGFVRDDKKSIETLLAENGATLVRFAQVFIGA